MALTPRTPDGALVVIVFATLMAWQGRSVLLLLDVYIDSTVYLWAVLVFGGLLSLFLTVAPPITEESPEGQATGE
ncbi:MAG: hypothetical protein V5A55_11830 [Halovenus sp.]